jgi:membrane protein DedA with SNARE-associated domain/rhodanese-related sulfurtransferase
VNDLVALVAAHGALLVFAATLAARIGAPVPAAPFLVAAASLQSVSLATALAAAVLASVIGDGAWFLAGRRYGYRMLKLLCKVSISPDSCVTQSESFFGRWGGISLLAAKFLPGVSVVAPPMAGALGMSLPAFIGYETLASAVWAVCFLALGLLFRNQIEAVLGALSTMGGGALAALALVAVAYLAVRYWRRRRFLRDTGLLRIGVDELRALVDGDAAPVIIDVRSELGRASDSRRIPGALPLDLGALRKAVRTLPSDRLIVAYCNCPNDASAVAAARLLAEAGLPHARPLAGGLEAWIAAGHPTERHAVASAGDTARDAASDIPAEASGLPHARSLGT